MTIFSAYDGNKTRYAGYLIEHMNFSSVRLRTQRCLDHFNGVSRAVRDVLQKKWAKFITKSSIQLFAYISTVPLKKIPRMQHISPSEFPRLIAGLEVSACWHLDGVGYRLLHTVKCSKIITFESRI